MVVVCKKYLGYYSRGDKIEINGEIWFAFDTDDYWLIEQNYSDLETLYGKAKESYIMDSWLEPIEPKTKNTVQKLKKLFLNNGTM